MEVSDLLEIINTDGYLSYINDFGKHTINSVVSYSYYEHNNEEFIAKNAHFTNDLIKFWNLGEGSRLKEGLAEMSSSKGITQRLLAYFARANYSYDDKYMATASIRREECTDPILDNRIYGKFDLYRRSIEGLIYNVQVPQPPNTESEMYKNIGTMDWPLSSICMD